MELSNGDGLDVAALFGAQWRRLVGLAVLLVDDVGMAEDVVQDAFLALQRKPPRNADAAAAYLRVCVVNGARGVLRRRVTARRHLQVASAAEHADSADRPVLVAAEHAELIEALRRLPRRQREVLVLRYWEALSEAEIAAALGVSVGTVKSTASRGLDALQARLGVMR